MDNFTFRQYLKESGYDKMTYQEEVYTTCLGLGNYQNIDLYYQDEIDEAYEQNVPVNELAAKLCAQYDKDYGTPKPEEIPEFEEEEYSQETLDAMADYPQDEFNEATETEETFEDWKGYVFKYLDKRVDVNKIKDLGTYIKDFVKQEWDNGEPSWFAAAESIVNYARTNFPDAIKDRSYATTITESLDGPATFTNELVNQFVRYVKKWFTSNTKYRVLMSDSVTKDGEHPYTHEKKKTYELTLRNAPVQTSLYLVVYSDYCYIAADGDRFSTKSYKFTSIQSLDKALNMLYDNIESVYGSLDEAFIQDDRGNVSITENKVNEARLSNKQKALAELEEYFGISADGDTIYTDGITRDDEVEIGNICAKYNVDFALGSKHITVYNKIRNEAFIQDDRGNVSITDLVDKIMTKAGMVVDMDDDYTAAAYYIADFYSKQSMPINGMVMWGARDLLKFKKIYDEQIQNANTSEEIQEYEKKAVTGVRSIMLGNPGKKWTWIEEIKDEVRKERKAAEEKRRQDYLNSDEYKKSQDPGWTGPRGTWTLGT